MFYGISCTKTDLHNKYMILCLAHILNKIIYLTLRFQEFMWKDNLNVHVFQNRNWCNPKVDQWFFSNLGRILSEKIWG